MNRRTFFSPILLIILVFAIVVLFKQTSTCFAAVMTCVELEPAYAPWCGTCSVLDEELRSKPQSVPENVTILKVLYDKDKLLKARYGVTTQHTLVQIDESGNAIKQWVGGGILELTNTVKMP